MTELFSLVNHIFENEIQNRKAKFAHSPIVNFELTRSGISSYNDFFMYIEGHFSQEYEAKI